MYECACAHMTNEEQNEWRRSKEVEKNILLYIYACVFRSEEINIVYEAKICLFIEFQPCARALCDFTTFTYLW